MTQMILNVSFNLPYLFNLLSKRNNNDSHQKLQLWHEDYLIETENLFIDNLVVPIYWFKIIILKNTLFSLQMKGNVKYFGYWAFILIQKFKGNEEIR